MKVEHGRRFLEGSQQVETLQFWNETCIKTGKYLVVNTFELVGTLKTTFQRYWSFILHHLGPNTAKREKNVDLFEAERKKLLWFAQKVNARFHT